MEVERGTMIICEICKKEFASISTKNRHTRNFHPEVEQSTRKKRMMCPLCPIEQLFSFHGDMLKHLTNCHQVNINESVLCFRNVEEFTAWKELENREVDYCCRHRKKHLNGEEEVLYNCNRSDSSGYVSLCKKRRQKTGGSIRIRGMCPSRIKVKIAKNGEVKIWFTETHVGHEDELHIKRLMKNEASSIKETEDLYINEPSISRLNYQDDVTHFIQESSSLQDHKTSPSLDETRQIGLLEITSFGNTLNEEQFKKMMEVFRKFKNDVMQSQEQDGICKKRKIEKQTYYPNKK